MYGKEMQTNIPKTIDSPLLMWLLNPILNISMSYLSRFHFPCDFDLR